MKRKDYQKPTMEVVELQQRATLLNTSTQLNVTYTEEEWEAEE